MKSTIVFFALFGMSISVQAHVEPGSHKGKTADGTVCEMVAGTTYFEKDTRHPLNERISITVNGDTFIVQHPPVVSVADKMAYFNHDQFQGVLATRTGGKALVVTMIHTQEKEGPSDFSVITHEYKADKRDVMTCKLD